MNIFGVKVWFFYAQVVFEKTIFPIDNIGI